MAKEPKLARKPLPQSQPSQLNEPKERPARKARPGACKFEAKGRCYVEGVMMEDSGQTITLSPAAAYRVRKNKNLTLVEGEIPKPAEGVQEGSDEEADFLYDLNEDDPILGEPPGKTKLIRQ